MEFDLNDSDDPFRMDSICLKPNWVDCYHDETMEFDLNDEDDPFH